MRRLLGAVTFTSLVMAVAPIAPASAKPKPGADVLNPPPPTETTCNSTGSGTTCRASFTTSYSFPAEFACSGFDIDEAGTTDRRIEFVYDRDGNLTKRVTRIISLVGAFSDAVTGKSVQESGHFTITHDYLTPGDLSTDQTTINGLFVKVVVPKHGMVFQDAGHMVFAPNGDILREGGHHQFENSEVAELCAALS